MPQDFKQHAPATRRNRDVILAVLKQVLPRSGTVLETASGTGEHAIYLAKALPHLTWVPSDADPQSRASIAGWRQGAGLRNLEDPRAIDVCKAHWDVDDLLDDLAAVVNINMVHIAPWEACEGLMAGAAECLPTRGVMFLYGPYRRGGQHTAASNEAFDRSLRRQNEAWGVRDLEAVTDAAARQGFALQQVVEMPANNLSVVFTKT